MHKSKKLRKQDTRTPKRAKNIVVVTAKLREVLGKTRESSHPDAERVCNVHRYDAANFRTLHPQVKFKYYQARKKPRSEYHMHFPVGSVWEGFRAGDLFVILKSRVGVVTMVIFTVFLMPTNSPFISLREKRATKWFWGRR